MKKESHDLKDSKEGYTVGFGGMKGKKEIQLCNCISKIK